MIPERWQCNAVSVLSIHVLGEHMARLNINQLLALILLAFSLGYLWMAYQIPVFPIPRPVDSDAFPKLLGFSLLLLSVFLFFEKTAPAASAEKTEDELQPSGWHRQPKVQVFGTAVGVLAYAFLIEPLGFLLASILLGVGLAYWFGYRQHWINLATVGGIVLALYLLMNKVMGIYLPQGLLPL
ncbi:Tricarboxylate transport protein TctB [Nitrincola lacisaponensis]|uniref:Tricarboxylate transport protein TctB n=2 Tax=Nitrincola lacisaponensis TaxID=267850 RepID=A0A063Y642_9GAMM|nr:Tricarboxylate transport protein TctB [Nitrincola lacisaponensis]